MGLSRFPSDAAARMGPPRIQKPKEVSKVDYERTTGAVCAGTYVCTLVHVASIAQIPYAWCKW